MGVYYIEASNRQVKIGFTSGDPQQRLRQLQTGTPLKLRLIAHSRLCPIKVEKDLHRQFRKYRVHGEWFRQEGELKELLDALRAGWELLDDGSGNAQQMFDKWMELHRQDMEKKRA